MMDENTMLNKLIEMVEEYTMERAEAKRREYKLREQASALLEHNAAALTAIKQVIQEGDLTKLEAVVKILEK